MSNQKNMWIDYYMEFADKLLEYKYNRKELINKIKRVFNAIDSVRLPKLDKDGKIYDIDPFTTFGLFNKKLTDENRIKIMTGIKNEFSLNTNVPTNLNGIPVLNPQVSAFYDFIDKREKKDIDNLWSLFEVAIEYVNNKTDITRKFIKIYDTVLNQRYVKWNITMGLYWIRPYAFLSLDKNNKNFLSNYENITSEIVEKITVLNKPPTGEEYLDLCDICINTLENSDYAYKSLPELTYNAFLVKHSGVDKKSDNTMGDPIVEERNYWLYSPGKNAEKWNKYYKEGIMAIKYNDNIGNLKEFNDKEEIRKKLQVINNDNTMHTNEVLALWQFSKEIKEGDVIFAKKGRHNIIGYGIVKSDYYYDEKIDDNFKHTRKIEWKEKGMWDVDDPLITKTLTNITEYPELINNIKSLFEESIDITEEIIEYPEYTMDDFLKDAFIEENEYNDIINLIKYKKNVILEGAPGVGKTYLSKRLVYSMMGIKDKSRVELVQFHQSYSYEDFIMGYRPSKDGFKLKNGIFYEFCKKAQEDKNNDYFFIIDEINRGNLSKIFGELFMLIEKDKRETPIHLLYNEELFSIPENLYIIGLMNTADRSLAMLDYALRRRFAFIDLKPAFDTENFKRYETELESTTFNEVIYLIQELNNEIKHDETLGEGFQIGHSYFSNLNKNEVDNKLKYIIEYEIIPLLSEYYFDEEEKLEIWSNKLRSVIK